MRDWHPPCFDSSRQWELWRQAARRSGDDETLTNAKYCADCTPEFKRRMERVGRCLHPEVRFRVDGDGLLYGVRETEAEPCGSSS